MSFLSTLAIFYFVQNQNKYFNSTNSSLIISTIPTPVSHDDTVQINWEINPEEKITNSILDLYCKSNNNSFVNTIGRFTDKTNILWNIDESINKGDYFLRVTANNIYSQNTNVFTIENRNNNLHYGEIILFSLSILLIFCCCFELFKKKKKNQQRNMSSEYYTLHQPFNPVNERTSFRTIGESQTVVKNMPIAIPVPSTEIANNEEDNAREASL